MTSLNGFIRVLIVTAVIAAAGLMITSCTEGNRSIEPARNGTIQLTIQTKGPAGGSEAAGARDISASDSTSASENSEAYEVLIYNDSMVLSTLLEIADIPEGPVTLSVLEGCYTVLVLAGYVSGSEGVLLGSGYEGSISVQKDSISEANILLTSVSHSLIVPESVTCSETFTAQASGATGNQLLTIVADEALSQERNPFVEIGDSSANLDMTCIVSGSSWTASVELAAPALPEESLIKFYGSLIKLSDPDWLIDRELGAFGSLNWRWLNYGKVPDPLDSEVEKPILFCESETGVGITIGWN